VGVEEEYLWWRNLSTLPLIGLIFTTIMNEGQSTQVDAFLINKNRDVEAEAVEAEAL